MAKNTGARGLRAILENILTDSMYEVSSLGNQYKTEQFTFVDNLGICLMNYWA